jgi:hypothetical protein
MTESQRRIVVLIAQREAQAKVLDETNKNLAEALRAVPVGEMFQDETDKTVYRVIIPTGTYVEYRTIGYERTKKEGEVKGTLSMKAAEEAGFVLPKGGKA